MRIWLQLCEIIQNHRRSLLLYGALAVLVLALIVLAATVLIQGTGSKASQSDQLHMVLGPRTIQPEDIFLPDEPDVLPPVLYFRERKDLWTVEDVQEFWINSSGSDRAFWMQLTEQSIDTMLEAVP